MPEKYNTRLNTLLNEQLEVPDGRDEDELKSVLLGFKSGDEEVKNVLSDATVLYLDKESSNFLKDYINEIDHSMEFARSLYAEEGVESLQRRYRTLFSLTHEISNDLERAVDEDSELESIARKLKDAHLLAEVDYEKEQLQRVGQNLEDLLERKEKLQALVNHFEELEEYVREGSLVEMLEHRKHVLELMLEYSEDGSKESSKASPGGSGPVSVRVPEKYLNQLREFARGYLEEVSGVFLCRKDEGELVVLKMVFSGSGTEGNVSPAKSIVNAVNELLDNHARYRFIDFHTHSVGTVRNHGDYYANNWSDGDLQNFKDQGEGYTAMLVTPEKVLLKRNGRDAELQVFDKDSSKKFDEWADKIDEDWKEVASGYSFPDNLLDLTKAK